MNCPHCQDQLWKTKTELGYVHLCMSCYGHAFSARALSRILSEKKWTELLELSTHVDGQTFDCPKCSFHTQIRRFHFPKDYVDIDICMNCEFLWFDKNEIEEFPLQSRQNLARANRKLTKQRINEDGSLSAPEPMDPDEKAQMLLTHIKVDEMVRKARNRSKYWTLRRLINTPWMLDAQAQSLTEYVTVEDL